MFVSKSAKWSVCLGLAMITLGSRLQVVAQQNELATVVQALRSAQLITPGTKRSKVEKTFEEDGGITFRDETVYVYRHCAMLKIRITFAKASKASETDDRAQDTVLKVSEMFVDWPTKD